MVNTILATVLRYMTTHSLALCIAGLQSHTQLSNINIQFNSIQFNSIRVLSAKCANVKAYNTKKNINKMVSGQSYGIPKCSSVRKLNIRYHPRSEKIRKPWQRLLGMTSIHV